MLRGPAEMRSEGAKFVKRPGPQVGAWYRGVGEIPASAEFRPPLRPARRFSGAFQYLNTRHGGLLDHSAPRFKTRNRLPLNCPRTPRPRPLMRPARPALMPALARWRRLTSLAANDADIARLMEQRNRLLLQDEVDEDEVGRIDDELARHQRRQRIMSDRLVLLAAEAQRAEAEQRACPEGRGDRRHRDQLFAERDRARKRSDGCNHGCRRSISGFIRDRP